MTATAPLAHTCLRSDLIETMADWRGGGEFQGLSWHINVLVPAIGTLVEALEGVRRVALVSFDVALHRTVFGLRDSHKDQPTSCRPR